MKKYNWATLGCGVIANELAVAMEKKGEKLYSVANRTHKKAVQFAEKYGIEKVFQRSFYDHVIRDRDDYEKHARYIYENPMKWFYDDLYVR